MGIKCILFDADGVIITSKRIFSHEYQRKFGLSDDDMQPFFNTVFQDCLIGKKDLKEEVLPFLKGWKWERSSEEFLRYWFSSSANIDKNILALMTQMKKQGIRCFIATNQERYRTEYMMDEMKLNKYTEGIFSSAHIGCKKPEKAFYQAILDILSVNGIEKDEVLFIDDSLENVQAAQDCGIKSYHYKSISMLNKFLAQNQLFYG